MRRFYRMTVEEPTPEVAKQMKGVKKEFDTIPSPASGRPLSVAVYSFADKTGQRRPQANVASFSTAVTQGAEVFLIKALQDVGQGQWFDVVERTGIDNLVKERTIIKQMRDAYEGKDAKPLMPMQFAGIIIEGGIVGYDSSINSGGAGMRIFGIGASTQYQSDTVTVSVRTVSVLTGEVLTSVTVTKTVLSYMDKVTLLRFINDGTNSLESEIGGSINESINRATNIAIQAAVVDTIREGVRKGHWEFKEEQKIIPIPKEAKKD